MPGAARRCATARSRNPPKTVSSAATKRLHVAQDLRAQQLGEHARGTADRRRDDSQVGAPAGLRRRGEEPDEPPVEERPEPGGRVEEVQRGPARRGVDDDEVPALGSASRGPQLAELLHRHVLLRAGEGARHAPGRRGWRRSARPSPGSACCSMTSSKVRFMSSIIASSRPPAAASTPGHRARRVVELAQAHRLGEPPGRVDRQHDDLAPALGRAQRERRRRRRLADPAGAAADDDPGARVVEQRVDVEGGRLARRSRAPVSCHPCSCSSSARSYSAPRSIPPGSAGSSAIGRPTPARSVRSAPLELHAQGVVGALPDQPVGEPRQPGVLGRPPAVDAPPMPAATRPATTSSRSSRPAPARPRSASARTGSRTMLTITQPSGRPRRRSSADGVLRLLDRHLLEQRDQVDDGLRASAAAS